MDASRPWLKRAVPFVQALVSLALLAWLLAMVPWREVLGALSSAAPSWIAAACLLYYGGVLLSCAKWRLTLRAEGLDLPFARLVRWYLIGAFAGNFLPTDIGGDLGRGLLASRTAGQPRAVARSIIVERLSGLAAMALLALLALASRGAAVPMPLWAALAGGAALIAAVAALLMRVWPWANRKIAAVWAEAADCWRRYRRNPAALTSVAALSVAFQILAGVGVWINMRAVGVALPVTPVVLAAAVTGIAGLLPLTISGWGVREGLIVALLTPFGADPASVLAGSLLGRALLLLVSLAGAAALLAEPRHTPPSAGAGVAQH